VRPSTGIADRLGAFVCARRAAGLHGEVLHDVKRLLLNQLKASAEAAQQPAGLRLLDRASRAGGGARASARVWWSAARATPQQAQALHRQLLDALDYGDTHLPSQGRFTAGVLVPLLVQAEARGADGRQVLEALAVGLEVAIACALAWPARGADAARAAEVGAVAACCALDDLDRFATAAALVEAQPRLLGAAAASADLLDGLGEHWRLRDIALHCRPVPVHALAPVEAVLQLRAHGGGATPSRMRLALSARGWRDACEAGVAATPDLRHCMALAWRLGGFAVEDRAAACAGHPDTLSLRSRIELSIDAGLAGLEACALAAQFGDGSSREVRVDAFLGSRGQPLSDSQLCEIFRGAAEDLVLPRRAGEILQAVWGLEAAPDVRSLLALLRRAG
jgi:2-methylcitrate dehydratase PrpD